MLAAAGFVLAIVALAFQAGTWVFLRRTRLRIVPVIFYDLRGVGDAPGESRTPVKVGVRVINLSDHPVEIRVAGLRFVGPDGSQRIPLQTGLDITVPRRVASYRHSLGDFQQHHADERPTAFVQRGDGVWIESWPGWVGEPPSPPGVIGWDFAPIRHPYPGRLRRGRLTLERWGRRGQATVHGIWTAFLQRVRRLAGSKE